MTEGATRRTVLATGAAALGAAAVGCGGAGNGGSGGQELARTSDIPVGGGKVFRDRKIVVTQPTEGDFKAFTAICTHLGCTVNKVADGTIDCPCHGSKYHIGDGSVAHGPARRPLAREPIKVEGNSIRLA
ncbi:Rieske (2Fe-2S) protein [Streptomyces sp. NK08204]|uniref:Rieske (2Fe-2S) protein n=1 Tax=Streptomyces sp. NK08204 TaxID=2873260 RepID=UPI001CED8445|nr:Rieske (2Fe-2S) protein [Streptomyces sp. NK08204]